MLIISSQWPGLLLMASVLLGWLAAAADIETSQTYKVLTDADNIGGSCSSRLAQVNKLIPEVQQLIQAATESIDTITKFSTSSILSSTKRNDRMRLLLLAQQFFGIKFNIFTLAVSDTSKPNLQTLKERYNAVNNEINKKSRSWRFACDDTWAEKVDTLQTAYSSYPSGEEISQVAGLGGIGTEISSWAFFDKGGPTLRPTSGSMTEATREDTQITWYINKNRGWSEDGPCSGIQKPGTAKSIPYAATVADQKIIYYCPITWQHVGSELKADITALKDTTISTAEDNLQRLDSYMSPGAILLHEMTHQVFDSGDDDLGYNFINVSKGKDNPKAALDNADSYNYFAVAAYLSQVEWHSGVARPIGYNKSKK